MKELFFEGCGELESLLTTFRELNFQVESVKNIKPWIGRLVKKLWAIEKSRRNQSKPLFLLSSIPKPFGDLSNLKELSMVMVSFKANLHPFGGLKKMPLRRLSVSSVKEPQKDFRKP